MTLARQIEGPWYIPETLRKSYKEYLLVFDYFAAKGDQLEYAINWPEVSQDISANVFTNQTADSLELTIKKTDMRKIDYCLV